MYVCMYMCMYVCTYMHLNPQAAHPQLIQLKVSSYVCVCACVCVCVCVCRYVYTHRLATIPQRVHVCGSQH